MANGWDEDTGPYRQLVESRWKTNSRLSTPDQSILTAGEEMR